MLRECFRRYLEAMTDGTRDATARALDERGLLTEATLLRHYGERGPDRIEVAQGPWAGRIAHVGPRLPPLEAGSLWFDTCELSLMVLVPRAADEVARLAPAALVRVTRFVSWLAVRP